MQAFRDGYIHQTIVDQGQQQQQLGALQQQLQTVQDLLVQLVTRDAAAPAPPAEPPAAPPAAPPAVPAAPPVPIAAGPPDAKGVEIPALKLVLKARKNLQDLKEKVVILGGKFQGN